MPSVVKDTPPTGRNGRLPTWLERLLFETVENAALAFCEDEHPMKKFADFCIDEDSPHLNLMKGIEIHRISR